MRENKNRSGQASVILVLVTVILISVTTLSVALVVTNAVSAMREQEGGHALEIAESGAEEGILRILRDPTATGTVNLTVDGGSATVEIVGSSTKTITAIGEVNGFAKTIEVQAEITAGQVVVNSWREL